MSEMLLLGAGISIEAGIPGAYDMTDKILERVDPSKFSPALTKLVQHKSGSEFRSRNELFNEVNDPKNHSNIQNFTICYQLYHVISFIKWGLNFQRGIEGDLSNGKVNIEELFSAMELLSSRYNLEASPFVLSWHPMIDEFEKNYHCISSNSPGAFARDPWSSLNRFRKAALEKGDLFRSMTEILVEKFLVNMVWKDDAEHVKYMQPIISLLNRQGKLIIATLNYDNCIELLARSNNISVDNGIEEWNQKGSINFGQSNLILIKIHGSIDWGVTYPKSNDERPMKEHPIKIRNSLGEDHDPSMSYKPSLVFGQRSKLRADGPFLALLEAFRRELSEASLLTIVGYSFRDDHINGYIARWINSNREHRIRIVDPYFDANVAPFADDLRSSCSHRIEVIAKKASEGLVQLYG